ncbi:MAG: flagellar hook-basal body protein [Phycisphaerae bacterium]|nr:flagellar hook-basal body protein [Phycisphaerae bacterium]
MTYGLWLSVGGLQVNQYRQEIITNNLANVETVGFKRDLAVIHERPVEAYQNPDGARYGHRLLDRLGGGNWVRPTYTNFDQGSLVHTGGDLDAAIAGDGFFTVREGDDLRYTRDGKFTLNRQGELVMAANQGRTKVLDNAGKAVQINTTDGKIKIAGDGTITQGAGNTVVAKLGVVEFADRQGLRKVGKNLFVSIGDPPRAPQNSQVHGGYIERSAQNPMTGLVEMIEATRAMELNARLITLQDQTIGEAVNKVGRVV